MPGRGRGAAGAALGRTRDGDPRRRAGIGVDFELTAKQRLIVETVRDFAEQETVPDEDKVGR